VCVCMRMVFFFFFSDGLVTACLLTSIVIQLGTISLLFTNSEGKHNWSAVLIIHCLNCI